MERGALLTAAFVQEMWLWYIVMSSRRRSRGLWNNIAEENCYGKVPEAEDACLIDDGDGDNEDADTIRQVAFTLPTSAKRVAHLESVIRLVKEMRFLDAR
jgi:hypothetical protein